jgi:UDP-N-acetylmuramate dehydrogenase
MLVEENKPLAPFTTFGIGGPARWFVEARSEDEIVEAAAWAAERGTKLFVLGGGSNLLVSDAGFDGLALRVGLRGIAALPSAEKLDAESKSCQGTTSKPALSAVERVPQTQQNESGALGPVIYRAAAGEDWDSFVERTVQENCAGVECLAGIPGTVGGTPVQNVGAYGQEVASAIERVRAFDLRERAFVEFASSECGFAYRRSRFNSADRGRYIVTRVDYRLTPNGASTLRYADLQRVFAERGNRSGEPSLAEVADEVRRIRQSKGMLIVADDPDCKSAGSFFKNPVVSEEQVQRIAAVSGKAPPRFPARPNSGAGAENQGRAKIPAAWLIEQAGFAKGYAHGAAAISSRHTLALVNRGGASAAEILTLAGEIADTVEARFAIRLEMEPVLVGF